MKFREALDTGKPYRRSGYHTGMWFQLIDPWRYFSAEDREAEDWEVNLGPPKVALTQLEIIEAVTNAYSEFLEDRCRIGYLMATHPAYPPVDLIVKHLWRSGK